MRDLPRPLRWYLWAIYAFTLCFVLHSVIVALIQDTGWRDLHRLARDPMLLYVAVFLVISFLGEHTTLRVTGSISQSLSTAAQVAAILLFPAPLPLLMTLAAVAVSQLPATKRALYKRLFNVCHPTLTVALSSSACALIANPSRVLQPGHFIDALPCVLLLIVCYYVLDVFLLLTVLSLVQREYPWKVWWENYRLTLIPELSAGTIGVLTGVAWRFDPIAICVVLLPVVALRLAFRAISEAQDRASALRRRSEQLEAVLRAGQRLRVQHSQSDLLAIIAEAARVISGAETVVGYLRDAEHPHRLERIVVVPEADMQQSPTHIPIASVSRTISQQDGETGNTLSLPIELEGVGVAGLLRLTGGATDTARDDRDALAILATQASIALQNTVMHERALAQASTDGLTGLANHKRFQTRLEEEVARAIRSQSRLSLIMVDLDDFKTVNNTYGHQTGDAMLSAVAGALRESVRLGDIPARYGGDEFAVILPETPVEDGMLIAARILAAVRALRVVDGGATIQIGASLGVAAFPLHAHARDTLIRAADQSAYAAKHSGKGLICRPEDARVSLDQDPIVLAQRLEHANMATVEALAAAVDAKDPYTRGHSQRVSSYAATLAEGMGLGQMKVSSVRLAGLLHDVGKIGVPDAILTKPGQLSEEEFEVIKQHSVIGERLLSQVPFLQDTLPAVRHHHERWDGAGYPDGLKGEAIPLEAAILMVADSFDAMTSSRIYRAALPFTEACRRMEENRGTQFHPRVVEVFKRAVDEGKLRVQLTGGYAADRPISLPAITDTESEVRGMYGNIASWMR